MKKRYFIVCYVGDSNKGEVIGEKEVIALNGYINRDEFVDICNNNSETHIFNIVITNIIELSKNDYKDFTKIGKHNREKE